MTIEDLQNYDFEFKVDSVQAYPEVEDELDVIYNVYYTLYAHETAIGDDYSIRIARSQQLEVGDLNDIIPFEDLNEEMVIGWVTSALTPSGVEALKLEAAAKVEELINPTSVTLKLIN